ncbi:MAG TPA: hypothetical protein VFU32_14665, partial [Ktedonobacterales bacterium]|nr:hypothetical protein [Ktedonobacterales bacterium]
MPELFDQNVEQFEVEPVTQLDGSPVSTPGRVRVANVRQKLDQPGMIALAEGLALALCFFLPWLSFPYFSSGLRGPSLRQYSGWNTAIGMPEAPGFRLAIFAHLWLIPVTAVALLVVAWLYSRRRVTARIALACILALSTLALLIAAGFYWQIASLDALEAGARVLPYAVLWGCWLAMCINV